MQSWTARAGYGDPFPVLSRARHSEMRALVDTVIPAPVLLSAMTANLAAGDEMPPAPFPLAFKSTQRRGTRCQTDTRTRPTHHPAIAHFDPIIANRRNQPAEASRHTAHGEAVQVERHITRRDFDSVPARDAHNVTDEIIAARLADFELWNQHPREPAGPAPESGVRPDRVS